MQPDQSEVAEKDAVQYDDKYYDLDDGFIDDGDCQDDEGFGAELGEGASNFYSDI